MMPTTCISPTMKVREGSSEKPIKKRLGCSGLPAKSKAGQKCMKNNSLHVKGNLKSEDVAVSGLFSTHSSVPEGRGLAVGNGNLNAFKAGAIIAWGMVVV